MGHIQENSIPQHSVFFSLEICFRMNILYLLYTLTRFKREPFLMVAALVTSYSFLDLIGVDLFEKCPNYAGLKKYKNWDV